MLQVEVEGIQCKDGISHMFMFNEERSDDYERGGVTILYMNYV